MANVARQSGGEEGASGNNDADSECFNGGLRIGDDRPDEVGCSVEEKSSDADSGRHFANIPDCAENGGSTEGLGVKFVLLFLEQVGDCGAEFAASKLNNKITKLNPPLDIYRQAATCV